uniref:polynucleotide adenylyltransferase n=1 Tax=Pavo cristatus TaxID=9049 RepID=A0A8C9FBZ8_PAVCR
MEEAKSSKNGNHDPRKSVRLVSEEGKAVKVTNNQNYKHNRNDKSVKDIGRSSPSGNSSKKSKQNDVFSEKQGENKSCKVNSCIPGTKDTGSNVQERNHGKVKKNSNVSSAVENLKQAKAQQMGENFLGSHVSGNGVNMETLTATQKGKLVLENPLGVHALKTNVDQTGDPGKIKNSDSAKEHTLEADYLENTIVIDESNLTAEQQLGLKQAEERLERDYISRLEKRSPEYTNCQYLCKLCLVHIENIQGAHKHIKEKRHKKNIMEKQEENELRALPPPSSAHLAALSFTLIEAANEQGISDDDFRIRQEIVNEMEKIIQQPLPDCSLRMYGSCLTRFAFKTSDINIDIKFPPKMSQPDVLIQVLEILKNSAVYSDVESDFHAKVPVVFCKDIKSGLTCKVSARNDVACLTTDLLAALGKLEPVLIPLVLAFRYWAKLCHIDCQAEGGIPSYSFALMVIFFLQQRKPPILPSYLGNWIEGFDSKKPDDHQLKGIEEDEFVRWEYKPSTNGSAKNSVGAEGKTKVEQQKGGGKKVTSSEVDNQSNAKEKHGNSLLAFKTPHQVSLGQLWLELLKFYTLEFALEEYVISIRVQELLTRENKNWPKRRIAIEDPFALKRNVARSLNSQMVFEYILERFRTAYKYFACPQSKDGIKSKPDTRKKEKGKINNKKSTRSEESVTNCCLPRGDKIVDKQTIGSGCTIPENELECNEMEEPVAKRFTLKNRDSSLLSTLDSSYDEDKEEALSLISNECCEVKQKSLKERDDLEISEVCLTEGEQSHHCNCSEHQSYDTNSSNEFSDAESRQSLVTESSQNKCTGTPATSHNCKAMVEAHDLKDEGRLSTEEMHYVFDKFILTSGKVSGVFKQCWSRMSGLMVDGWNAFFFDDMEELKKRLPSLGKNTESLGELWLGLLRFYTEEFDFKEYVISIRQKKLLTTFEKQWTSKCIAIEDPFDLNHNLGAGEYFFDSKVLTDGELAPNDRCCRVCGKIGHYMKDCPKRRRLKKKENEKDDEKEVKEDDRETREKRCFICGDVGHVRRDCPEFKQARQRNNSVPSSQLVRSMVNSQLVAVSQQQVEGPLRTRQSSECSDSHQSSYSPQPQQFTQNSSQPASINQTQPQPISQSKHVPQPQQGAQPPHQVQLSLFNFPQSPPGQYSTLHNLGLLQMHHHQIQLPNTSWPIHGPVIHSAPGNPPHSTNSSVSLNDPSIIFAQPAARPMGIPSTSHEGHWHNPVTPNSLVNNGTVGNSGQFGKMNPPSVPWDHGTPTHFPLFRGAWPYNMPQNYMQQGNASYPPNKPFYPQGTRTSM